MQDQIYEEIIRKEGEERYKGNTYAEEEWGEQEDESEETEDEESEDGFF